MQTPPINVILGLGNPGQDYEDTRHNVGFMVVNTLLNRNLRKIDEKHKFDGIIEIVQFSGRTIWLVKPQTYMNLSGKTAAALGNHLNLNSTQILVVYDCMDIPLGRFRLRKNGSSGGQKGMESVLQALGTRNVPRLRVGIGRDTDTGAVNHVLSKWNAAEQEILDEVVDAAADAVLVSLRSGIDRAMNDYNDWRPKNQRASAADDEHDPKTN